MQADLIIVGAGMVGSTLALALEGSGLDILVLDASPLEVCFAKGRVILHGRLEILKCRFCTSKRLMCRRTTKIREVRLGIELHSMIKGL